MRRLILALLFVLVVTRILWALSTSDSFSGGDGGLGASWTTGPGQFDPAVVSGVVRPAGADSESAAYHSITPAADQWTQWTTITWSGSNNPYQYGLLRQDTGADTKYKCQVEDFSGAGSSPVHNIVEIVAGGGAGVIASGSATAPSNGDVYYCEIVGTNIDFKKNTVSIVTVSDATIASGRVGFGLYGAQASHSEIDNWSGGDFVSATSPRRIIIVQ